MPEGCTCGQNGKLQIEDSPHGYPRYAALIASHRSFHVFRRFGALRTRILLHQQDAITVLEQELAELDRTERRPMFLGNLRRDTNYTRKQLLERLGSALKEYDDLLERTEKAFKRQDADTHSVRNLQNWVIESGQLARDETAYLERNEDMMAVTSTQNDRLPRFLEWLVEDLIIWVSERTGFQGLKCNVSRDPNVIIFHQTLINAVAQVILTLTWILLLFLPVLIMGRLEETAKRLVVTFVALTLFLTALSIAGKPKTADLCVAGATYATILVIFITPDA